MTTETPKPQTKTRRNRDEELEDELATLARMAKLDSWASFINKIEFPQEFVPALLTMRVELLPPIQPRAFTPEEGEKLLKLIAGLLETNMALRMHAEQTAHLVDMWAEGFKHFEGTGRRIQYFANFAHRDAAEPVDEN